MANHQRDAAKEQLRRNVPAQRASGLSVRAFCRQQRLAESAIDAWQRTIWPDTIAVASGRLAPEWNKPPIYSEPAKLGAHSCGTTESICIVETWSFRRFTIQVKP
jgi:hypothetical protein